MTMIFRQFLDEISSGLEFDENFTDRLIIFFTLDLRTSKKKTDLATVAGY